jgi:8-oxo-dGTP diphosphatase
MEPIRVVAAVIQRDGKILACRRAPHKSLAGLWEFPGGIAESVAPAGEAMILLNAYWAQTNVAGEVSSTDHDRMEWLAPADLETVTWAPADVPFLALVLKLPSA